MIAPKRKKEIEQAAYDLQKKIYRHVQKERALGTPPLSSLFEPEIAAELLGYQYEELESLGSDVNGVHAVETAGLIDRANRKVRVSLKFKYETRRFTAAHEIGHIVLHDGLRMHRDRPLSGGPSGNRSKVEEEADYFAAVFLAAENVVKDEFEKRFGKTPVILNETSAYWLRGDKMHELLRAESSSLDFFVALAGAHSYGGHAFRESMAEAFGMSNHAMALRIRELDLARTL